MKILRTLCIILPLLLVSLFYTPLLYAATIKTGESIYLSEETQKLEDLYLFGSTITSEAPVTNDLVAAGGNITLNGDVSGSLMAAGGDVVIRSNVGNTLRVAGGNVVISGKVNRDVLIAAGSARITKTASISGDLLFAGSELIIEGPVRGKVTIYGEQVVVNNTVGSLNGSLASLRLGNKAVVEGDLRYTSPTKAEKDTGANVMGEEYHQQIKQPPQEPRGLLRAVSSGALYALALDILLSAALVFFLREKIKKLLEIISKSPVSSFGTGFFFVIFWPLLSLIMLIFLWLAAASFLLYGLVLIVSMFLTKIIIGWRILTWWYNRQQDKKITYVLDWKTAVVGSLAVYILLLIPVIGWLIAAFAYFITVGAVIKGLLSVTSQASKKA